MALVHIVRFSYFLVNVGLYIPMINDSDWNV